MSLCQWLPGKWENERSIGQLKNIKPCQSAEDLLCIIHWATFGEGTSLRDFGDGPLVCINPLSWRQNDGRVEATQHLGAAAASGEFTIRLMSNDIAQGFVFEPHAAPMLNHTWAACHDGQLIVADQSASPLGKLSTGDKNYHGLDYPLFYMNIRRNASDRVNAYLAQ